MTEAISGKQHYKAAGTISGGGNTRDNALAMTAPLVARFWDSENNSRKPGRTSHALATSLFTKQHKWMHCIHLMIPQQFLSSCSSKGRAYFFMHRQQTTKPLLRRQCAILKPPAALRATMSLTPYIMSYTVIASLAKATPSPPDCLLSVKRSLEC